MYSVVMATIGEIIKERRTALKLSQRELGKLVGVSHTYVYNLENGKNDIPSPDVMAAFAQALRVAEETLLQSVGYLKNRISETAQPYMTQPLGPSETWQRLVDLYGGDEDAARRYLYETLGEGLEK